MSEQPTVVDPVCGMSVNPAAAARSIDYEGTTYHFCCPSCASTFEKDPSAYTGAAS